MKDKKKIVTKSLMCLALGLSLPMVLTGCAEPAPGKSAYDIAVDNGFEGTEQEWLDSLKGDAGKDGSMWYVGTEEPTNAKIGDLFLNTTTLDIYQKTAGGWTKIGSLKAGATKENPLLIATADDFAKLGSTSEYTYVKLVQNIDLRELNSLFINQGYIAENFVGEIDGNGKTITFNSQAKGSYQSTNIFQNVRGRFHDFTLHYPNIEQKEINFCSSTIGETEFENITVTGSITAPSSSGNFSPYINYTKYNISFKNCTNEAEIKTQSYGSLFLGGYAYDGSEWLQDPAIVGNGLKMKGVLKEHIKVSFINCKNTANVEMQYASMLYGNSVKFPQLEDIIIENCVNEGTILGYAGAGLFCGHNLQYLGSTGYNGAYTYLTDYVDSQNGLNAESEGLKNGETGAVKMSTQKSFATYNSSDNSFGLKNTTAGNKYKIFHGYYLRYYEHEGDTGISTSYVTISKEYTAEGATLNTDFKKYRFITDAVANSITNKEEVLCTDFVVTVAGGISAKLYIVTDKDTGTNYYHIVTDGVYTHETTAPAGEDGSLTIYEYNAENELVGYQGILATNLK